MMYVWMYLIHISLSIYLSSTDLTLQFALVGTLEGFTFDSEDEADKIPKAMSRQSDENEGVDEQNNGKNKRKAVKSSVCSESLYTIFFAAQQILCGSVISLCSYTKKREKGSHME